jgi:hypothetical protein
MLDSDFCTYLEYQLCDFLKTSEREDLKGFWCDGVLPANYSKKYINDNRTALLKAFIGKDGQTEFEILLEFGPKALSNYAKDLTIQDCIPKTDEQQLFIIDTKNKKMRILLY